MSDAWGRFVAAPKPQKAGGVTSQSAPSPLATSQVAPSVSLPKAGGAIRGIGEKFTASPVTGTGSMSVPIAVSPGRSGFGPQLSLSYDSGRGNGPFGFGWSLSLPAISRKTDKGLPRYADAEESDVFLLSDAEDLVPVLDAEQDWARVPLNEPAHAPGYRIDRYRPRTEGLFARIERWTCIEDGDVHWRSVTRDNVTTWYGADANSRIADPHEPHPVFSWLICRSYDDKGNAIVFDYAQENSAGVDTAQAHEQHRSPTDCGANRYIKRIRYGNRVSRLVKPDLDTTSWMFEVVFDYGEHDLNEPAPCDAGEWTCRDDPFSSYRSGFEVRTYRLCRRVLMFHRFPDEDGVGADCLVRSTDFGYQPGDAVGTFLTSVTQRGYRRSGDGYVTRSLPPVELHYSPAELHDEVAEVDPASLSNLPAGLAGDGHQWADLDGEGISGILAEQAGTWYYKPNLGAGRFGPLQQVPTLPSMVGAPAVRPQLLDLAGDGQLDVVAFAGPTPGFFERTTEGGWTPLRDFLALPALDWADPNLRFVDLDGDGHADVLVTEHEALTWYPSRAEEGFGPARRVRTPDTDGAGPRLVFADGTESVHLADMSGDGLTDLVRIRNGEVCYWPSLGYGRFGAKVTMDDAPWFDRDEMFDQRYLRLADVDGSGVTDIVYLHPDAVRVYLNRSGNAWSPAQSLRGLPGVDNRVAVATVDLFGTGTACLVWSSDRPGDERRSMRYVDLLGGVKPHLLVRVDNNLGAETHVHYASSTSFSLADKAAGRPWLTRLPFPVQVVERVETHDRISHNRFVTRYAYHHGFFDGVDREFRGFGMVEQWDTEQLAVLVDGPDASNIDEASHVPPVLTRTWFHTGAFLDAATLSRQFADEYYREPGLTEDKWAAMLLDDTVPPEGVRLPEGSTRPHVPTAEELREACRALKGSVLRQEVYALDGSEEADRPYRVAESNYTVELLQPRAGNRHAVCFVHPRETLSLHYERKLYDIERDGTAVRLADPRVTHELVLDVDGWGNVLRSAAVAYGRRHPDADLDPLLPADARNAVEAEQQKLHATLTVNSYTNAVFEGESYRAPLPYESRTYQLVKVVPDTAEPDVTTLFRFDELRAKVESATGHDLPYEDTWASGAVADHPYRRLLEHTRTLYRNDLLTGPLALGQAQSLGLPYESYTLAFTPGLLAQVYRRTRDGVEENLLPDPAAVLGTESGYVEVGGHWWVPSGRVFYSADSTHPPAQELAHAQAHFFLPVRFVDPFKEITTVAYDPYDLLVAETRDPLDNRVTAGQRAPDGTVTPGGIDYRVLAPRLVADANRNRAAASFDALGLVAATAVMGKPEEQLGDSLDAIDPDLPEPAVAAHLADPLADPHSILGSATSRLVYDLFAYSRTRDDPQPQPAVVSTLVRETHHADLAPGEQTRVRPSFTYSDGFGRAIQAKAQAELGPLVPAGPDVSPRWVGTGWTVFNNKGKPVRQYEPFFSATHGFEFAKTAGMSPVLCYDPVERVVVTLAPDDSYAKVIFDPWRQATWDGNDTVLLDPRTDEDVRGFLEPYLATQTGWQTWHQRRAGGALGPREQAAAVKTEPHAATPAVAYADSLGRTFLTVAHNRAEQADELYPTRVVLDIEGNQREVIDAREVTVLRSAYDVAGRVLHTRSPDAGQRWSAPDIGGQPIRRWDSRGHEMRHTYDPLRRPVELEVRGPGGGAETLAELAVYGESHPEAVERNLRGRLHRQYDGAGVAVAERHDFKGNPLAGTRRLARSYQTNPDWASLAGLPLADLDTAAATLLESESFATETSYDALNRPVSQTLPDGTEIRPGYNEAGLLESVDARLRGAAELTPFVTDINYDAKGQRERCAYSNGAVTSYTYDPFTFRLRRLETLRGGEPVQDLTYTYDATGNITDIGDAAQQTVFFAGQVVTPTAEYVYDPLYRLISATGREHASIGTQPDHAEPPMRPVPHPNDGQALRLYTETYTYDQVGNILTLAHQAGPTGSWTRRYSYADDSNRLLAHSVPGDPNGTFTATFDHDAHGSMTSMPHLVSLTWDFDDHLASVDLGGGGTAYYTYDAAGQRTRKVIERNGGLVEERIYLSGFELYRRRHNGGLIFERETVHLTDDTRRIALFETTTVDANDPTLVVAPRQRYQLDNHLGSSNLELDETAVVISYEEYHPYGTTSLWLADSAAEISAKRYRYTGKEKDEETALYYHGARYYACWLVRWTSCDPVAMRSSTNPYLYVHDAPVSLVDPNGKDPVLPNDTRTVEQRNASYQLDPKVEAGIRHQLASSPKYSGETKMSQSGRGDRTGNYEDKTPVLPFFIRVPSQFVRTTQTSPQGAPAGLAALRELNAGASLAVASFSRDIAPGTAVESLAAQSVDIISGAVSVIHGATLLARGATVGMNVPKKVLASNVVSKAAAADVPSGGMTTKSPAQLELFPSEGSIKPPASIQETVSPAQVEIPHGIDIGEIKSMNWSAERTFAYLGERFAGTGVKFEGGIQAAARYSSSGELAVAIRRIGGMEETLLETVLQIDPKKFAAATKGLKYGTSQFGNAVEPLAIEALERATGQALVRKLPNAGGPDVLPTQMQFQFQR